MVTDLLVKKNLKLDNSYQNLDLFIQESSFHLMIMQTVEILQLVIHIVSIIFIRVGYRLIKR